MCGSLHGPDFPLNLCAPEHVVPGTDLFPVCLHAARKGSFRKSRLPFALFLFLVFPLLFQFPVLHAEAQGPSLPEILAAHEKAKQQLQSLKTGFEHTRVLTVFQEKEDAQGILYYKQPDRIIWQFTAPEPSETVINSKDAWTVFPRIKQVQKLRMDNSDARRILSVIGFATGEEKLSRLFDISLLDPKDGLLALRLVPVSERLSPFFSEVELWIDSGDYLPRRIVLHESSRDLMIFRFHDFQKNVSIPDSMFQFQVPEGFTVVAY